MALELWYLSLLLHLRGSPQRRPVQDIARIPTLRRDCVAGRAYRLPAPSKALGISPAHWPNCQSLPGIMGQSFSPEFGLQIRSYARRSLAFDWKDTGWLAYSNHKKLVESLDPMRRYKAIAEMPDGVDKDVAWLEFGATVGADVVVLSSGSGAEQLTSRM